jgi:hypothetical protein
MNDIKLIIENFRNKMAESEEGMSSDGLFSGDPEAGLGEAPLFTDAALDAPVDVNMSQKGLEEAETEEESEELVNAERIAKRELAVGVIIAAIGIAGSFLSVVLAMLGGRFAEFNRKLEDYIAAISEEAVRRMAAAEADYKAVSKGVKRKAAKEKADEIRAKIRETVEADEELNRLREEAEHLTYLVQTSHRQRKDKGPGIKGLRTPEATEIRKKQKEVFAQFKERIETVVVEALKAAEVEDLRFKSRTNYPTDLGGYGDYATRKARYGE